jgi:hypothetical protein
VIAHDSPMGILPLMTSSALNLSRETADSETESLKARSSSTLYAGRRRDSLDALAIMTAIFCILYTS